MRFTNVALAASLVTSSSAFSSVGKFASLPHQGDTLNGFVGGVAGNRATTRESTTSRWVYHDGSDCSEETYNDDDLNVCGKECKAAGKGSSAASILGLATATKAFAASALVAGAAISSNVDAGSVHYTLDGRVEPSSGPSVVLKRQMPAELSTTMLLADVETAEKESVVGTLVGKMVEARDTAQAKKEDEATIEQQARDAQMEEARGIIEGATDNKLQEVSEKAKDEIKRMEDERLTLDQREGSDTDATMKGAQAGDRLAAEKSGRDSAAAKSVAEEEAGQLRLEKEQLMQRAERLEAEVRRLEKEKSTAEASALAEKERIAKMEEEVLNLGKEKKEQQTMERLALEDETRAEVEQARLEKERVRLVAESTKIQQEQERARIESDKRVGKLEAEVQRLEEEKLAAEASVRSEKERIALVEGKVLNLEKEKALIEQQSAERLSAEEKTRAEAEQTKLERERERLLAEAESMKREQDDAKIELERRLEAEIGRFEKEKSAAETSARAEKMRIAIVEEQVLKLQREIELKEQQAMDKMAETENEKIRATAEQDRLEKERKQSVAEAAKIQQELENARIESEKRAESLEAEVRRLEKEKKSSEAKELAERERIAKFEDQILKLEKDTEETRIRFRQLQNVDQKDAGKAMDSNPNGGRFGGYKEIVALAAGTLVTIIAAASLAPTFGDSNYERGDEPSTDENVSGGFASESIGLQQEQQSSRDAIWSPTQEANTSPQQATFKGGDETESTQQTTNRGVTSDDGTRKPGGFGAGPGLGSGIQSSAMEG
ncbi:hypothetical protein ACHAWF_014324, partial [Thalassiosira exigua]